MASSSSSPSAPAFTSHSWKYDVFLSFRGEDTRRTFVDHLYAALERQGINTYKDDITLPRGESIGPSLLKAIEDSQIALIIFSENYGDSSWCLEELAHIMKCRIERGQTVMPIFYDVDPSEVRKQKRKYKEAFSKHMLENKAKVESWRKALEDASSISGWEPRNIANGHEAKGIEQFVIEILQKLQPLSSSANENLIGMAARMVSLRSKLKIGSGGVLMIGIWGIGGGGKTTLASSIYDETCGQFDGCCFVPNIKEEASRNGLRKLEENILSDMRANNVRRGRCLISNRFRDRKVLIVLDDVDHRDQLEALAGSHGWFGEGSRIIITTPDKHLLAAHKVNVIHNISLLEGDEAIKLFCKHAPRDNRPVKDYEHLLKEVVSYADGLPLALTVLGSFLCDKDIGEWRSALARLKEIPDKNIVAKLKISFDGLTKLEKDLFLDIACFFRWEKKDKAMEILDACGFHPVIGVKVLTQRALITISEDGRFDMHDLVQEMGHHIVRGEHPNNPEKHSRVWKKEDILKICAMDATTELDMIEAIRPDIFSGDLSQRFPRIGSNMKNLRLIDLRVLKSLFPAKGLCFLRLDGFLQKRLWKGCKVLPNLKILELRNLDKLEMTPDFDGLPKIERFKLYYCMRLEKIHPSIERLKNLVFLSVEYCRNLKEFPPIAELRKLEVLKFGLSSLRDTNMNHTRLQFFFKDLRNLYLRDCNLGDGDIGSAELPNLKTLDLAQNKFSRLSFNHLQLPRLKWLDVSFCKELVELSELPSSIAVVMADYCESLERFGDISNCQWLWKVSFLGKNKLDGNILLDSMLRGNAIEDHSISVTLQHQIIPKGFVRRLFKGRTATLHFPDDWYNDFCGFSICIVTQMISPVVNVVIKQEVHENSLSELQQESNETLEPGSDETKTFLGYVSFGSLRHPSFSDSSYTMISVNIDSISSKKVNIDSMDGNTFGDQSYVGAKLVPRKSKGDEPQTTKVPTDSSEFWNEGVGDRPQPFTIQHDSKSSIKIKWQT